MENKEKKMEFLGGSIGAYIPFASLVIVIFALVLTNHVSLKVYWAAGFLALCISFLFAKNKGKEFNDRVVHGLVDPMFSTFMLIFLLAGVLSFALRQSGLINGLLWACESAGVNPSLLPMITFLTCVVISTSCGTTGGTVSTVTPVMFPLAVGMGCDPALMLGAIISGSFFGDNLAPISDTTIASSGGMDANVLSVVKSRIKYSIIGGLISLVLFAVLGLTTTNPAVNTVIPDASYAKTLVMLVVPAAMVIMMLKGMELVPVLLICDLAALVIDVLMGFVPFSALFETSGPIISGLDSMISVIIFTAFVFVLLGFTRASGVFERLINGFSSHCKNKRQAELVSYALITLCFWMCGTNTAAIVIAAPVVRALYEKFGIDRHRGANILDGVSCGWAGVCPYNSSMLVMFGIAVSSGVLPEGFSVVQIFPYSFHCICLIFIYLFAVLTGWGRKDEIYQA